MEQQLIPDTVLSDAQVLVQCFHNSVSVAAIDPIVIDCHTLMESLPGCSVRHVRRNGNFVAHNLVGLAKQIGSRHWLGPPPVNCNVSHGVMPVVGCFPRFS